MNYQDIVDLVRQISNAINPSGHFVHGRNTDGSLDYDYPFPQIHLLPVQTTYDVANDIKDHTLILMFWEQDSPESSNLEREAKIAAMDQLSDLFLAAIYNNTVFQVSDVLKTPEYRQLAGTASGYGLSFTLITKVDCDEEPFQLCADAEYELTIDGNPVDTGSIPSGGFDSIPIDGFIPPCEDATAELYFDSELIDSILIPSGDTGSFNIDCNTLLNAVDVFTEDHPHSGIYKLNGTLNGKPQYVKSDDSDRIIFYNGTRWVLQKLGGGGHTHLAAVGNENYPWEADWSSEDIIMIQATIQMYCINGDTCEDATYDITVNSSPFDSGTIPSGGNQSIPILLEYDNGDPLSFTITGNTIDVTTTIRESDYVYPYHYSGTAPFGSLTNQSVWTVKRIDFTTFNSPVITTGTGSWTNRYSLIYT